MALYDKYLDVLFDAARKGEADAWPALWEGESDKDNAVRACDKQGRTLLMMAAQGGAALIMADVLAAGAEPDAFTEGGSCAVHRACYDAPDEGALALLIRHGAEVNRKDRTGHSGLTLLFGGTTPKEKLLDKCAMLLAAGADPNAAVEEGHTALMLACARGSIEAAHLLLDYGADSTVLREIEPGKNRGRESARNILNRMQIKHRLVRADDARYLELHARMAADSEARRR